MWFVPPEQAPPPSGEIKHGSFAAVIFGIAAFLLIAFLAVMPAAADDTGLYAPDRVIVKYFPQSGDGSALACVNSATPAEILADFTDFVPGLQVIQLPDGVTVEDAIAYYRVVTGVVFVEPDYYVYSSAVPNDPYYSQLWGLKGTSSSGGVSAESAWNYATGSSDVVVAVLDSGVDYTHPDLAGNIWKNPGEIPDNGIDDDGNGYVDDVYGWNFIYNNNDTRDFDTHGSHCAGTVGAVGNNGVGVAGTSWNVSIMPVSILSQLGSGNTVAMIAGIEYAVNNGADILSMSCGYPPGYYPGNGLREAINAAGNHGVLCVIAAGNDDNNNDVNPVYPASYECDNIISVAASNQDNNLADFSNYGARTVDLAAPGTNIYSTVPSVTQYQLKTNVNSSTQSVFGVLETGWTFTSTDAETSGEGLSLLYLSSPVALTGPYSDLHITTSYTFDNECGMLFIISNKSFDTYNNVLEIISDLSNHTNIEEIGRHTARTEVGGTYSYVLNNQILRDNYATGDFYFGLLYLSNSDSNSANVSIVEINKNYQISGHAYDSYRGTSMATPMVAGAAALLKSVNSSLTYSEIKSVLMSTVDRVGDFNSQNPVASGGRLNLSAAVEAVLPATPVFARICNTTTDEEITGTTVDVTYGTTYPVGAYDFRNIAYNPVDVDPSDYTWSANNSIVSIVKDSTTGNATLTMNSAGAVNLTLNVSQSGGSVQHNKAIAYVIFNINKITPSAADVKVTPSLPASYEWNREAKSVTVTNNTSVYGLGDITVKYNGSTTEPSGKGTYNVNVSIGEGANYTSISDLYLGTVTITGRLITKPTLQGNCTYDGTEQSAKIPADPTNYTITDNKSTAAGTYTATVSLVDKTNTSWEGGGTSDFSIVWGIDKRRFDGYNVTVSVTPNNFTYDGTVKTPAITVTDKSGSALSTNDYTIADKDKSAAAAGTYIINVTGKGNYTGGIVTASWTIDKAVPTKENLTVTPELPKTYVYNGTEHNVSITNASGIFGLGGITVKYNGLTTEPKNAGTYKVNASIADGSNYSSAEIYVGNIIINKKNPSLSDLNYTIPSSVNFTGEAQPVSVKANTSVNGLGEITVKYKGANSDTVPINATAYQVNVSIADGTNYNATETDITIGTLRINKVVPSESDFTLTPTSAVYNGANLTTVVSAKYSGMGDITNVTYNDEENVSAVGEYIVRVNVTGGNNYHAADYVNAGNFTITQPVNPPSPSRSGGGTDTGSGNYKEYDRSVTNGGTVSFGSSPTVTSVDLPAGVSGSVALIAESETPAPSGKQTVKIFEINIPNYPSGKESSVQFKLTVAEIEKAGYTPADICLYHCDAKGVWTKLPTTYVVKDGTVYYEAVTTEFSPFAIVYEKGAAKADENIVVPTATAEPVVTVTAPAQTATSSVQPTATATASPLCTAGLIAGLGCVLLAIRRK